MSSNENVEEKKREGRFDFLTTDFLRTKTIQQKYRNMFAIGLYAFVGALVLALILTHYNRLYLQTYLGLSKNDADILFSYSTASGSIGLLLTAIVGGAISDDYRSK